MSGQYSCSSWLAEWHSLARSWRIATIDRVAPVRSMYMYMYMTCVSLPRRGRVVTWSHVGFGRCEVASSSEGPPCVSVSASICLSLDRKE